MPSENDKTEPTEAQLTAIKKRALAPSPGLRGFFTLLNNVVSDSPRRRVGVSGEVTTPNSFTRMTRGMASQTEDNEVIPGTVITKPPVPKLDEVVGEPQATGPGGSLLDKPLEQIQEELVGVEEPPDDGGFSWYNEAYVLGQQQNVDLTQAPAVLIAIVHARSKGNPDYVYGDAHGLFGMSMTEKKYVQQSMRHSGALEPDQMLSDEDYLAWRAIPENQLLFYAPLIYGFVVRGMEAGVSGADLAEMVGKQVELPGSRVLPNGAYATAFKQMEGVAVNAVNEEYPDGIPDSVRVKAGIMEPSALEAAGMKLYREGTLAPTPELGDDTSIRMVSTAEGKSFEAGDVAPQLLEGGKVGVWLRNKISLPVKQWAGMMYNSTPAGRTALEMGAATIDRIASLFGSAISAATATVIPIFAVGGFVGTNTSNSDGLWQSFGMRSSGAWQAVKQRIRRTGEIWEPDRPDEREDEWYGEYMLRKWRELKSDLNPEGLGRDWVTSKGQWHLTKPGEPGWKELKRVFVPGAVQDMTTEELDAYWDEQRDFSYSWLYDERAHDNYLKDKARVQAEINARRAMDGLPPRALSYREVDRLKVIHENADTEAVGEMFGDWTWFIPARVVRGLLRSKYVQKPWTGVKALGMQKIPGMATLFTEHVSSQALKWGNRSVTTLEDVANGFKAMLNDMGKTVPEFLQLQGIDNTDTGGLVEFLQVFLKKGKITDWDGNVIDLAADIVEGGQTALERTNRLTARLHTWVGVGPDLPKFGRRTGPRVRSVYKSLPRRLGTIFRIFADNPNWVDPEQGLIDLVADVGRRVREATPNWAALAPEEQMGKIIDGMKVEFTKEFKMKHGIPQAIRGKDMIYNAQGLLEEVPMRNPATMAMPNYFRALWIEANLSARPGFTVRNVFDSLFRALVLGGHGVFAGSLNDIIKRTPYPVHDLLGGFGGSTTGASAELMFRMKRLPRFWDPRDWFRALRHMTDNIQLQGAKDTSKMARLPWPIGRALWKGDIRTPWGQVNLSYTTIAEMMRDWNEAFEVMLRLRLYDKAYHGIYNDMFHWYSKEVLREGRVAGMNLSRGTRRLLQHLFNRLPSREEEMLTVLKAFLKEQGLARDLIIPQQVYNLVEGPELLKEIWDVQDAKRFLETILDDLWQEYEIGGGKLTADRVRGVLAKHEEILKTNYEDAIKRAGDEDVSGGGGGTPTPTDSGPHTGNTGDPVDGGSRQDSGNEGLPERPGDSDPAVEAKGRNQTSFSDEVEEVGESLEELENAARLTGAHLESITTSGARKIKKRIEESPDIGGLEKFRKDIVREHGEELGNELADAADAYLAARKKLAIGTRVQEDAEKAAKVPLRHKTRQAGQGPLIPTADAGTPYQQEQYAAMDKSRREMMGLLLGRGAGMSDFRRGVIALGHIRGRMASYAQFMNRHPSQFANEAARGVAAADEIGLLGPTIVYAGRTTEDVARARARAGDIMADANAKMSARLNEIMDSIQQLEANDVNRIPLAKAGLEELDKLSTVWGFLETVVGPEGEMWKALGYDESIDAGLRGTLEYLHIRVPKGRKATPAPGAEGLPDTQEYYEIIFGNKETGLSPDTPLADLDVLTGKKPEGDILRVDELDLQHFSAGVHVDENTGYEIFRARGHKGLQRESGVGLVEPERGPVHWDDKRTRGVRTRSPGYNEETGARRMGGRKIVDVEWGDTAGVDVPPQGHNKAVDEVLEVMNDQTPTEATVSQTEQLESISGLPEGSVNRNIPSREDLDAMSIEQLERRRSLAIEIASQNREGHPVLHPEDNPLVKAYADALRVKRKAETAADNIASAGQQMRLEEGIRGIEDTSNKMEVIRLEGRALQGETDVVNVFQRDYAHKMTLSEYIQSDLSTDMPAVYTSPSTSLTNAGNYESAAEIVLATRLPIDPDELPGSLEALSVSLDKLDKPGLEFVGAAKGIVYDPLYFPASPTKKDWVERLLIHFETDQIIRRAQAEHGLSRGDVTGWGRETSIPSEEIVSQLDDIFTRIYGVRYVDLEDTHPDKLGTMVRHVVRLFYRQKARGVTFTYLKNYLRAGDTAIANRQPLTEAVMLSMVEADERLGQLFGQEFTQGISLRNVLPDSQPRQYRPFANIQIRPEDYLTEEMFIKDGWEWLLDVQPDGTIYDEIYTSVADVNSRFLELATDFERMTNYAIVRIQDEVGRPGWRIAQKGISGEPWQQTFPDFVVMWLSHQKKGSKWLAKWGLKHIPETGDVRAATILATRLRSISGVGASAGLGQDTVKMLEAAKDAYRTVLEAANNAGNNVPRHLMRGAAQGEQLLGAQEIMRARGYAELESVTISRRWTPKNEKGEAVGGSANIVWRDLQEFNDILKHGATERKGRGRKAVGAQRKKFEAGWRYSETKIVQKDGEWQAQALPKSLEMVRQLNINAINFEPRVSVLKATHRHIQNLRGKRRLWKEADKAREQAQIFKKGSEQRKAWEQVAENWEQADRDAGKIAVALHDRILTLDPGWENNQARLAVYYESLLNNPESPLSTAIRNAGYKDIDGDTREFKRLPRPLQMEAITEYIKENGTKPGRTFNDVRTWAMVEIMHNSAFRIGEAVQIKWGMVNLDDLDAAFVLFPDSKATTGFLEYPLQPEAAKALQSWKQFLLDGNSAKAGIWSDSKLKQKYVFAQETATLKPFSRTNATNSLSTHIKASGGEDFWGLSAEGVAKWVGKDPVRQLQAKHKLWRSHQTFTPHDLRRYYAVKLFHSQRKENGTKAGLEAARELLGHQEELVTILHYLRRGGVNDRLLGETLASGGPSLARELPNQQAMEAAIEALNVSWAAERVNRIQSLKPRLLEDMENPNYVIRLAEVSQGWKEFLESGTGSSQDFIKKNRHWLHELSENTKLEEGLMRAVAQRSESELMDVPMTRKIIVLFAERAAEDDTTVRSHLIGEILDELGEAVPPPAPQVPFTYTAAPDTLAFEGYRLVDEYNRPVEHIPFYIDEASANEALDFYTFTAGIRNLQVQPFAMQGSESWAALLGKHYADWRRWKWSNYQDDILDFARANPDHHYNEILQNLENFQKFRANLHKAGLTEFHPLINADAPLGYQAYLKDMRARGTFRMEAERLPPVLVRPDDELVEQLNEGLQFAKKWKHRIQKNQTLGDDPLIKYGDDLYVLVGPRQAYKMVPVEEYETVLMPVPKGWTEKVDPEYAPGRLKGWKGEAVADSEGGGTIYYEKEEYMENPAIRNHEVGHVHLDSLHPPGAGPDNNTVITEVGDFPFEKEYARIKEFEKFEFGAFREDIAMDFELWLLNPARVDDALRGLFDQYFGAIRAKGQTIRMAPRKYNLTKDVAGSYEGVLVSHNKKKYALSENTHFFYDDDVKTRLTKGGHWHTEPVFGNAGMAQDGLNGYRFRYAVVELDELRPQYVLDGDTLKPNKGIPEWLVEPLEDADDAYEEARLMAQWFVPEWAFGTTDELTAGVLVDSDGLVLNGTNKVLAHHIGLANPVYDVEGKYMNYLGLNSLQFGGFEPATIRQFRYPVLVRMLDDKLNENNILRLVNRSNRPRMVGSVDDMLKAAERDLVFVRKAAEAFGEEITIAHIFDPSLPEDKVEELATTAADVTESFTMESLLRRLINESTMPATERSAYINQSGVHNQEFRDRVARALLLDMFGEKNASEAFELADLYIRTPDHRVRNLVDAVLENYPKVMELRAALGGDAKLGAAGFDFMLDVKDAAEAMQMARMYYPEGEIVEAVRRLASKSDVDGIYHLKTLAESEKMQLLANTGVRAGERDAKVLQEIMSEYLDRVNSLEGAVVSSEEMLRNVIREFAEQIKGAEVAPGRTFSEGAGASARTWSDEVNRRGQGTASSPTDSDAVAGQGRADSRLSEGFTVEELEYIAAYHGKTHDYLRSGPEAGLNLEFAQDISKWGRQQGHTIREIAKRPGVGDKRLATKLMSDVARTWGRPSDFHGDMSLPGGVHEWITKMFDELHPRVNQYEGPHAWTMEDLVEQPAEFIIDGFRTWLEKGAESARNSFDKTEQVAYSVVKDWLDQSVPMILGSTLVGTGAGARVVPSYGKLRIFLASIDEILLNGDAVKDVPLGKYRQVSGSGGFMYTDEGLELREKIWQLYITGQEAHQWRKLIKEGVSLPEEELEAIARQLNDITSIRFNSIVLDALKKKPASGGTATVNFGGGPRVIFPKRSKHADKPAQGADILMGLVLEEMDLALTGEDQFRLLEMIIEMPGFGVEPRKQTQFVQRGNRMVRINEFHYADLVDRVFNGKRIDISNYSEAELLKITGHNFKKPEDVIEAINQLLEMHHSEMMEFGYQKLGPENMKNGLSFLGKHAPQYTMDSVPETLLFEAKTMVKQGKMTKQANQAMWKEVGIPGYGDSRPLGMYHNRQSPYSGISPGEQSSNYAYQQYLEYQKMLDEWRYYLLGDPSYPGRGVLGEVEKVDGETRDQLFRALFDDGGIRDDLRALRHTAMYGTRAPGVLQGVLQPGVATNLVEKNADDKFRVMIREWENGMGVDADDLAAFDAWGAEEVARTRREVFDWASNTLPDQSPDDVVAAWQARWDAWRTFAGEEPAKYWDWAGLRKNVIAREGLGSVQAMTDQLTPEELAAIVPGYFNWGYQVPFMGRRGIVLGNLKPHKVTGALDTVGDAMVDYSTNMNIDQIMKNIFPFWLFPTRSLKFWAGELAARPKLLSTWAGIQGLSERMAHDAGATDTRGHQLPRLRGHVNLKGTGWWFNPTNPYSFSQAIPNFRSVYGEVDPEAPILKRMATYLYSYGPQAGFHLAPWISVPMHRMEWLDENNFPKRSLFGQADLMPEWGQRWLLKKAQDSFWFTQNPDATWTPEVSWKDFLVERQVLANLEKEIGPLHELDRLAVVKEAEVAIMTRAGSRWEQARQDLEGSEYFARIVGYLSGMYGKQFHKGEKEIYAARDEASRLRRQIALDADYEDFYKDYRYNTAEGLQYGLYRNISWVTNDEGEQLFGKERWEQVSENISYGQQISAKLAAMAGNRRMLEIRLADLPVGAPYQAKEEAYGDYDANRVEILKQYPGVVYPWGPYNKNDETVREHIVDKWMGILSEKRPAAWNREEQNWDQYQTSILEWEAELPQMAVGSLDILLVELAGEKLFEPLKDHRGQIILDENGEEVDRIMQIYGSRERLKAELLAMATGAAWNAWDIENDDLYDALNRVRMDNYESGLYDALGSGTDDEATGSVAKIIEREYDAKFPGGPTTDHLRGWIREQYGDKWTDEEIAQHIYGTGVLDREERRELQATERQQRANEIFQIYGWAGPRGAKQSLYDALSPDVADVLRDFVDPSRKRTESAQGLYNYWSEEFFTNFYNSVYTAAIDLGLTEPTDEELEQWALAEELNEKFKAFREEKYGPNWSELNAMYVNKDNADRLEFRNEYPELYTRLKAGWEMKDAYGKAHPGWQKFFDPDAYHGTESTAGFSGGGSGSLSSVFTAGGKNWRHVVGPGYYRNDYRGVSLKEVIGGLDRPQIPAQWPNLVVSRLALQEILSGKVSDSTVTYLQALHQKADPYNSYESFLDRLRMLAKTTYGDMGGDYVPQWPWEEGYESA